jgi:hypothetical protein
MRTHRYVGPWPLDEDETQIETYYIHVLAEGTEQVYPDKPDDLPCLKVERDSKWEFTTTATIRNANTFYAVPPRGDGWQLHDTSADKWTGWRRAARRVA